MIKLLDKWAWIMIFVGLLLIGIGIYDTINATIIEGDCFDKNHNKINELTCEVRHYPINDGFSFVLPSIVIIMFFCMVMSCCKMRNGK